MSDDTEIIIVNKNTSKPTVKDLTHKEAVDKLWSLGLVSWKFHEAQLDIYEAVNKCRDTLFVINVARQLGKCRKEGSTCLTPNGPVAIETLKPGDKVYGYNKDGSISLTDVVAVEYQGEKEVVDLIHNGQIVDSATKDHRYLTEYRPLKTFKERTVKDIYKGIGIVKRHVKVPCGSIKEPHAYAIAALLGDGCSRQGINQIHISSEDNIIPTKVANALDVDFVYKQYEQNYTWVLSKVAKRTGSGYNPTPKVECNHYDEWCRGRYAHEKTADWEVINTWDRSSCLEFLAGLIDTDGSVFNNNNVLNIIYTSQSRALIDVVEKLIFKLVNYKPHVFVDKRAKYKNGPCYTVKLSNNQYSKLLLSELTDHMVCERKRWKPEYENCLEHNSNRTSVGVKFSEPYRAKTWDIQVNNETSLYLTGHGLVTHNSFMLCGYAIEFALQNPGVKIHYLAPTAKMVKKIILPRMSDILRDCPKSLKPVYKINEQVYKFHNGSEIHISGTDSERAENLRGQVSHLIICDEAGFMDKLDYVVSSILTPLTITTGGKIILSSTPPISPDHPFKEFADQAKLNGNYIKKTIFDNKLLTTEVIERYMREQKGPDSVSWRREFLAEFIIDEKYAVIPEASEEHINSLTKEVVLLPKGHDLQPHQTALPMFFDAYTVADLGYKDNTGILFGYWDFLNAQLVIQDELMLKKPNTQIIADAIHQKEVALWGEKKPYLRFCDGDLIAISNLNTMHDLPFSVTRNDNPESAINEVRLFVADSKLIIDPRCKFLLSQIKNATYDSSGKKFSRSEVHGHYDLLAALMYMIRNIRRNKNPYPPGLGLDIHSMHFIQAEKEDPSHGILSKALLNTDKYFKRDK
jgi:hypothetical protein